MMGNLKSIITLLLVMLFCFNVSLAQAAEIDDYEQARLDYLANLACITAYNDNVGRDARAEMRKNGYKVDSVSEIIDNVNVKYQVIHYSDVTATGRVYMLAIAGTENKSDVDIDLDTKQVYFAGSTPAEFAANAAIGDMEGLPLVHRGFNRYVQMAFFTPDENGEVIGEYIVERLKAEPDSKLYLVGHSLGGAAAVIAAARLIDMGVDERQLGVINFGAPEVGNAQFAAQYGAKLNVRRIAMQGDIVKYSLNTMFGGYRHVGDEIKWQRHRTVRGINHSVYVYFDRALRNFYKAQTIAGLEPLRNDGHLFDLYVEPLQLNMPSEMEDDREYIERSIGIALQNGWHDKCWFGTSAEGNDKATQIGAKYILRQMVDISRAREKRMDTYEIDMIAGLYDTETGNLLGYYQLSGSTQDLSPLMLVIYQTIQIDKSIKDQLYHKQKDSEDNETN